MLDEQIKSEIIRQLKNDFKNTFDLLALPLIAPYRVVTFAGLTDGSTLTPLFDMADFINKILIIKGFRLDYYVAQIPFSDIALNDGVTTTQEFLSDEARINRLFDIWDTGTEIKMLINGSAAGLFGNSAVGVSYPADLNLDNIFYKFPEKIQSWSLSINSSIYDSPDVNTASAQKVHVKATFECYLL